MFYFYVLCFLSLSFFLSALVICSFIFYAFSYRNVTF